MLKLVSGLKEYSTPHLFVENGFPLFMKPSRIKFYSYNIKLVLARIEGVMDTSSLMSFIYKNCIKKKKKKLMWASQLSMFIAFCERIKI